LLCTRPACSTDDTDLIALFVTVAVLAAFGVVVALSKLKKKQRESRHRGVLAEGHPHDQNTANPSSSALHPQDGASA